MAVTMTLDAQSVRALRRYVDAADAERTGMTLRLDGDLLVPQIDGYAPGDEIPVGIAGRP